MVRLVVDTVLVAILLPVIIIKVCNVAAPAAIHRAALYAVQLIYDDNNTKIQTN